MSTSPTPDLDALIEAQPDLVDRIFEYLIDLHPEIAALRKPALRRAVRQEFRKSRVWVADRPAIERARDAQQVLALFNGRNASEIARTLGISRATVYRYLKQAGYRKFSLSFSTNETADPVPSARPQQPAPQED